MINYFAEETPAGPVGDRVVFTVRRWQAVVLVVCMTAVALAFLAAAVAFAATDAWAGVPIAVTVAAGAIWVGVRMARMSIVADRNGVVVRNLRRTHRLTWDDVNRFRGSSPTSSVSSAPTIVLANGGVIKVLAASRSALEPRNRFDYLAVQLNELMRRVKSGEMPPT